LRNRPLFSKATYHTKGEVFMTISEKSAYLKGLMDGLSLNTETDEGKMISAIVDLLGDMAKRITDIEETTIAISDELDEIEEDLDAIEDFIMDVEDDYDEEDDQDSSRLLPDHLQIALLEKKRNGHGHRKPPDDIVIQRRIDGQDPHIGGGHPRIPGHREAAGCL
jgi:hypothetical protein